MHLLIVSQYYWPESFRINDIAEELVARGHQVTVLTGMPNYPQGVRYPGYGIFKPHKENHNGVNIHRVPIIARGIRGHKGLLVNYLSYVVSATALGLWRCPDQYDVILVYGLSPITQALPAIWLKFFKRIPLVLNVQDLWPESVQAVGALKSPRLQRWLASLVRFIYRRCDWLLLQSRAFADNVVQYAADPQRMEYWPNMAEDASLEWQNATQIGVDNTDFDSAHLDLAKQQNSSKVNPVSVEANQAILEHAQVKVPVSAGFCTMFAGNIGDAQDFPTILAAAKILQQNADIHFVIVGDGSKRAWAESQVVKQGLTQSVHFIGKFPYEQMPQLYAQADALLVTLRPEAIFAMTVPSKVQSYLSSGKPIVAALDGEGAAVIQEAQAGTVGPAGDAAALAENIRSLYTMSPENRRQLGLNGRSYFLANYTRAIVVDQLEARLRTLIKPKSADTQENCKPEVSGL